MSEVEHTGAYWCRLASMQMLPHIEFTTRRVWDGWHAIARQRDLQQELTVWGETEEEAIAAVMSDDWVRSWSELAKLLAEMARENHGRIKAS